MLPAFAPGKGRENGAGSFCRGRSWLLAGWFGWDGCTRCRGGAGYDCGGGGFSVFVCGFLQLFCFFGFFSFGFGVGDVAEFLQAAGELLGGEDVVLLVDGYADQGFELTGEFTVAEADVGQ